jgi:ABC-type antimicrobial peptide transport system permease subunit
MRYIQENGTTAYSVLAAAQTVSAKSADLQVASEQGATNLTWRYPFNITQLDANDVLQLSQQASNLRQSLGKTLTHIDGMTFASPLGTVFDTLSKYNQQIVILNIVLTFLLLIILAIVLFLVSMMSDVLVEQQAAVIAMLRSRGATRRHIFGTFVTQGVVLSLASLLAGPLLSLLLVRFIAQILLSPVNQSVISVITAHPLRAILDVKWYALVAVVVSLFVMIIAIRQAAKLDIVTLRRESSRTKRVSLWRRLNLDYLLVLLIVTGYGAYIYFWQEISALGRYPVLYNVLQGVSFIAPALIVAALLMLFLRLFPSILRLTANLAAKRRGASPVLAFAQMERAPSSAVRVVVLLALAIATSCFLLTLIATKNARASDAANFAVGADFRGAIPAADSAKTFTELKTQYSQVPGVQSVTPGYYTSIDTVSGVTRIEAVDADTYAHTALWTQQNSSQSLSSLTTQLVSHRADASTQDVVYALVDSAMWQAYHLSPGERFGILVDETNNIHISFVALAEVATIPGIYDTPINPSNGVGLLVDYQSYAAVYAKESGTSLVPNMMWLRTRDDAASLASVRHTFPDLADRRQLTSDYQENNIHLDIIGVLMIGIGAVLVLSLVGTLLSSWLNATNRRSNFAVMRALGMAPRQIAAVLFWEQGFVYVIAFVLGIGLGAMLITFVAPTVSLLDLAGPAGNGNPYDVPPVLVTIPYVQLLVILGVMVVICLGALLLMSRIVSRPLVSGMLRLNED